MEDRKLTVSVSTFLLIISIIVIIVMSIFIGTLSATNNQLNEDINRLEEEKQGIQTKLDLYKDTLQRLVSANELPDANKTKAE